MSIKQQQSVNNDVKPHQDIDDEPRIPARVLRLKAFFDQFNITPINMQQFYMKPKSKLVYRSMDRFGLDGIITQIVGTAAKSQTVQDIKNGVYAHASVLLPSDGTTLAPKFNVMAIGKDSGRSTGVKRVGLASAGDDNIQLTHQTGEEVKDMVIYDIKSQSILSNVPADPIIYNLLPNVQVNQAQFKELVAYYEPIVMSKDRPNDSYNKVWMETADFDSDTYNDMFQTVAPLMMYNKPTMCAIYTGDGMNGKSSWLEALSRIIGSDNISALTVHDMGDFRKLTALVGKLANLSTDEGSRVIKETGAFKKLTDHETLKDVRILGGNKTINIPTDNLFTIHCMNTLAMSDDTTDGFARRLKIVKFGHKFPRGKYTSGEWEDITFTNEFLIRHLAEITAYANYFTKHGWKDSELMNRNINQYMNLADNLAEYSQLFNKYCGGFDQFKILYNDYKLWCEEIGEEPSSLLKLKQHFMDYYRTYDDQLHGFVYTSNKYDSVFPLTAGAAAQIHGTQGMFGNSSGRSIITKLQEDEAMGTHITDAMANAKANQNNDIPVPNASQQMTVEEERARLDEISDNAILHDPEFAAKPDDEKKEEISKLFDDDDGPKLSEPKEVDFQKIIDSPVFPVSKDSKVPMVKWGNPDVCHPIKDWTKYFNDKYPDQREPEKQVSYGLPTGSRTPVGVGKSLIVVDVDNHDGTNNAQRWWNSTAKKDPAGFSTLAVKTPHGMHYYYWYPDSMRLRNTAGAIYESIDTRAEGGYVKSPVLGMFDESPDYTPVNITKPIARLPKEIEDKLIAHQTPIDQKGWIAFSPQTDFDIERFIIPDAPEGERNNTLVKMLGTACAMGATYTDLEWLTSEYCKKTGLPEREAKATLKSSRRWIR